MIDVARLRRDTPGAEQVCHLNNAGSSLPPRVSLDAVVAHLELEATIGGYEAGAVRATEIEAVYGSIGRLIGAERDEIAFIENATRAWDMAFYSLRFEPGDRIITGMAEYASNAIAMLQVAAHTGVRIDVCPDDEHGQLDVAALELMLDDRVRLIAAVHAPTQGGLLNPVAAIGRVARAAGIPYLLDACQSVGQVEIDVETIGCDMLSATGRKFLRGPRGTGFMYVRREALEKLEPAVIDIHAARWITRDTFEWRKDAKRFEVMEYNVADRLGMGAAVDHALAWGLDAIEERILGLSTLLRGKLNELPRVIVRDQGTRPSGINTFTIEGCDLNALMLKMRTQGINTAVTNNDWAWLDLGGRGIEGIMRASLSYYNTEEEVERFVEAIARA